MRLLLAMAALCVTPLHATEDTPKPLSIGYGIICNTSDQALRLATLRNEGRELPHALRLVNQEAANPTACGEALIVFRGVEEVHNERVNGQRITVMKVIVSAVSNGVHWTRLPDLEQYALVVQAGIEV